MTGLLVVLLLAALIVWAVRENQFRAMKSEANRIAELLQEHVNGRANALHDLAIERQRATSLPPGTVLCTRKPSCKCKDRVVVEGKPFLVDQPFFAPGSVVQVTAAEMDAAIREGRATLTSPGENA